MEWATDLVVKNLARNGITNQTSLQGSLVPFCVPFICWPLSSLSIKMLALAEIFAILWMKSHMTVQPLNPLGPKSDQHQISPCNITAL